MRIEPGELVMVKDDFGLCKLPDRQVVYVGRYPVEKLKRPYVVDAVHVGVLVDSGVPIPFRDSDIVRVGE